MSDDSTMSPVQALKALWQKHAGMPEEGTEDAGRWEVLRRAAAAQGEGVAFDEWVLEQEARLDERGMLIDIRNAERRQAAALEQIATALERAHPKQLVDLTCGELFEGVTFSSEAQHEDVGDGETLHSYVRLALDDLGLGFDVRAINDEPAECYGDATAEWHFTSPDELHALASAFRTRYAAAIDMVATTWAQRIADGTIPAPEA